MSKKKVSRKFIEPYENGEKWSNRNVKKTKKSDKVDNFVEQVKQGPYYLCKTLNPVSNYLSKKNIMFSQQSCVIQVNDLIKKIVHMCNMT